MSDYPIYYLGTPHPAIYKLGHEFTQQKHTGVAPTNTAQMVAVMALEYLRNQPAFLPYYIRLYSVQSFQTPTINMVDVLIAVTADSQSFGAPRKYRVKATVSNTTDFALSSFNIVEL
jgi:hypothetical protein